MSSTSPFRSASVLGTVAAILGAIAADCSAVEQPMWNGSSAAPYPPIQTVLMGASANSPANGAPPEVARRANLPASPLARVIKNPDRSKGLPPYALTDNSGAIQRYVEPVPGIDMELYVGSIVRVRHDTGRTLLASQLELPPPPLLPLIGASTPEMAGGSTAARSARDPVASRPMVHAAEFIDNDDATVELVAEEELPNGGAPADAISNSTSGSPPTGADTLSSAERSQIADEPVLNESLEALPMYGPPLDGNYPMMDMGGSTMDGEGAMGSCPECGQYHPMPGFGLVDGYPDGKLGARHGGGNRRFFADLEINFLRAHIMENAAGKLSEKYEFSPRVILGFDAAGKIDGRARYWHYGRDTEVLDGGGGIRVEFDVLDVEATRGFAAGKSEVVVAAGLRAAKIDLTDDDNDTAGSDLFGMTLAADLETPLCCYGQGQFTGVCGARLSLLGGDWGQDGGNDLVPGQLQDDNVVVDELYAGVGYNWCYRKVDLSARMTFEMQNWHSDALSQFAGADSIGFLGPGLEIGAEF